MYVCACVSCLTKHLTTTCQRFACKLWDNTHTLTHTNKHAKNKEYTNWKKISHVVCIKTKIKTHTCKPDMLRVYALHIYMYVCACMCATTTVVCLRFSCSWKRYNQARPHKLATLHLLHWLLRLFCPFRSDLWIYEFLHMCICKLWRAYIFLCECFCLAKAAQFICIKYALFHSCKLVQLLSPCRKSVLLLSWIDFVASTAVSTLGE